MTVGKKPPTWTIRVVGADLQWHTSWLQSKDCCYLTANTKLSDYSKAVTLTREDLAHEFCQALQGVMRKRHGDDVDLIVEPGGQKKTVDDDVVIARIAQRLFAPNKRPT